MSVWQYVIAIRHGPPDGGRNPGLDIYKHEPPTEACPKTLSKLQMSRLQCRRLDSLRHNFYFNINWGSPAPINCPFNAFISTVTSSLKRARRADREFDVSEKLVLIAGVGASS